MSTGNSFSLYIFSPISYNCDRCFQYDLFQLLMDALQTYKITLIISQRIHYFNQLLYIDVFRSFSQAVCDMFYMQLYAV